MKILIAITSEDYAKQIGDNALRLVGRAGYDWKLFVPRKQRRKYAKAIDDANYDWYMAIDPKQAIETKTNAWEYAITHDYDLLVTFPHNVGFWHKNMDEEIFDFCAMIGKARSQFAKSPRKRIARLRKGVTMERVQ
jgi:hypothetical protein